MTNRKLKFTPALCLKLSGPDNGSKAIEYTDLISTGLKLSVSSTGLRTWYWRYIFNGSKCAVRIGSFPGISVDEARSIARNYGADVDRGNDPKQLRAVQDDIPTFKDYALSTYLPYASERKRSYSDDESKLRLHLIPIFGNQKLNAITRFSIESYQSKIRNTHSPATSNRHLALLSRMFNLAISWSIIEKNPCAHIKKFTEPVSIGKDFKFHEIKALLDALANEPNQKTATALKLLMFTGLRKREVLNCRWEYVDLKEARIFLPITKSKPRMVALNSMAIEVLKGILRVPDSPWVFPGKDISKPLNNINKAWKRVLKDAGIEDSRVHDLRHHFATSAASAGVSMPNLMGLLGHSNVKTAMRYAHHTDQAIRSASEMAVTKMFTP